MNLSEIVTDDRTEIGQTLASKKKTLEVLSGLLAKGTSEVSEQDILNSLIGREKLGSTALGHGVAIPHGRMAGVTGSVGAFLRLDHGVDYDAHDGQSVDLVFGLLVPQSATEEHLQHLAKIAELFSEESTCQSIRDADSAEAVHAIISGAG